MGQGYAVDWPYMVMMVGEANTLTIHYKDKFRIAHLVSALFLTHLAKPSQLLKTLGFDPVANCLRR